MTLNVDLPLLQLILLLDKRLSALWLLEITCIFYILYKYYHFVWFYKCPNARGPLVILKSCRSVNTLIQQGSLAHVQILAMNECTLI